MSSGISKKRSHTVGGDPRSGSNVCGALSRHAYPDATQPITSSVRPTSFFRRGVVWAPQDVARIHQNRKSKGILGREVGVPDLDEILPLTPTPLHMLVAPANGPRPGYAIAHEMEELTDGRIVMEPGTLYHLGADPAESTGRHRDRSGLRRAVQPWSWRP